MKDAKVSDLTMVFEQHDRDLWTVSGDLKLGGLDLGCRMTVIRRANGKLWIHSPVTLSDKVKEFLLGLNAEISDIVAPNSYHHLFVKPYLDQFKSQLWTVSDVKNKRPDLENLNILSSSSAQPWPQDFKMVELSAKRLRELVFLHNASKTLILTDLAFNLPLEKFQGIRRWLMQKMDVTTPFGPSLLERKYFAPKSKQVSNVLAEIASWDFERIIMAHGAIVQSDGSAIFREAFRYYLD